MVVKQDPRFSRRSQCHGTRASPSTSAIHPTKGTYPTTAPIPRTDEVSLRTWARLNTELGEIDSRELPLQLAFTKRSRSGAQPSEPSPSPPAVSRPVRWHVSTLLRAYASLLVDIRALELPSLQRAGRASIPRPARRRLAQTVAQVRAQASSSSSTAPGLAWAHDADDAHQAQSSARTDLAGSRGTSGAPARTVSGDELRIREPARRPRRRTLTHPDMAHPLENSPGLIASPARRRASRCSPMVPADRRAPSEQRDRA